MFSKLSASANGSRTFEHCFEFGKFELDRIRFKVEPCPLLVNCSEYKPDLIDLGSKEIGRAYWIHVFEEGIDSFGKFELDRIRFKVEPCPLLVNCSEYKHDLIDLGSKEIGRAYWIHVFEEGIDSFGKFELDRIRFKVEPCPLLVNCSEYKHDLIDLGSKEIGRAYWIHVFEEGIDSFGKFELDRIRFKVEPCPLLVNCSEYKHDLIDLGSKEIGRAYWIHVFEEGIDSFGKFELDRIRFKVEPCPLLVNCSEYKHDLIDLGSKEIGRAYWIHVFEEGVDSFGKFELDRIRFKVEPCPLLVNCSEYKHDLIDLGSKEIGRAYWIHVFEEGIDSFGKFELDRIRFKVEPCPLLVNCSEYKHDLIDLGSKEIGRAYWIHVFEEGIDSFGKFELDRIRFKVEPCPLLVNCSEYKHDLIDLGSKEIGRAYWIHVFEEGIDSFGKFELDRIRFKVEPCPLLVNCSEYKHDLIDLGSKEIGRAYWIHVFEEGIDSFGKFELDRIRFKVEPCPLLVNCSEYKHDLIDLGSKEIGRAYWIHVFEEGIDSFGKFELDRIRFKVEPCPLLVNCSEYKHDLIDLGSKEIGRAYWIHVFEEGIDSFGKFELDRIRFKVEPCPLLVNCSEYKHDLIDLGSKEIGRAYWIHVFEEGIDSFGKFELDRIRFKVEPCPLLVNCSEYKHDLIDLGSKEIGRAYWIHVFEEGIDSFGKFELDRIRFKVEPCPLLVNCSEYKHDLIDLGSKEIGRAYWIHVFEEGIDSFGKFELDRIRFKVEPCPLLVNCSEYKHDLIDLGSKEIGRAYWIHVFEEGIDSFGKFELDRIRFKVEPCPLLVNCSEYKHDLIDLGSKEIGRAYWIHVFEEGIDSIKFAER
ncbi:uncharacterized protein LOC124810170 isoform X2 [Hydra vulgaris]|uniref:uncharacterized protein LOC124810170 isoform X2 n=1 Tax=Hydra vulgaris TaxID=6087 RepID=UPI0032E9F636